ncbi:MAG TPA: hypothetical protein PLF35_08030 [Prolixibacteraceae bacterium]|nr:hypothetical protein [Prolixibacteraceae bacterium]
MQRQKFIIFIWRPLGLYAIVAPLLAGVHWLQRVASFGRPAAPVHATAPVGQAAAPIPGRCFAVPVYLYIKIFIKLRELITLLNIMNILKHEIMNRIIFTSILLFFFCSQLFAQTDSLQFNSYHKNIYAELFGSHLIGGVNFDMRLNKGQMDGIGFRVGVGGINVSASTPEINASLGLVTFPIEFNYLYGKKRSFLLTGIGILPLYAAISGSGEVTNNEYINEEGFAVTGGFLTIGYRFQPKNSGIMFQANWNPMFLRNSGFFSSWFGLGLGFGFK